MPFFTPFFISDLLLDTKTISPHRRFVNFYFSHRALLPEKRCYSTLPKSPQSASLLLKCNITPLFGHAGIYKNTINATFPLPHGVSPIPFPLCTSFEGTHGTAPRGGNTRHAHRQVSFSRYATRSPIKRTTLIGSLVLIVKLGARYGRRLAPPTPNKHIPFISFARNCPTR